MAKTIFNLRKRFDGVTKVIRIFFITFVVGLMFIGCGTVRMNYKNMDSAISWEEQSLLCVGPYLGLFRFDDTQTPIPLLSGRKTLPEFRSSVITYAVSVIPAGEHTFDIYYYEDYGNGRAVSANINDLRASFLPGRFYYMYPDNHGDTVSIQIMDITDEGSYRKSSLPLEVKEEAFKKLKEKK